MSKKFKASASSSRVQQGAFGNAFGSSSAGASFGSSFGAATASQLSYVYEPPDLASISDSSVVVSLKNLQKKDGTTRAKALDELLAYVSQLETGAGSVEDGILEAWTRLYARTSIDNARQVRQRAHTLQGRLTSLCGKRIAKLLPTLAPPWVCGLQDSDKLVVRSAQEAFVAAFPTDEKRSGFWKVYHRSILDYCTTVVLQENAKTLSDERTTNEDDADAKYYRTVGSAVFVIIRLLDILPDDQIKKEIVEYDTLFGSNNLWDLASAKDSFARQSVYSVLLARLTKFDNDLDESTLKHVAAGFIGKALRSDQTGSSTLFIKALALLTRKAPLVWTSRYYTNKKRSSSQNLEHFLGRLPTGTTAEFWESFEGLLKDVPPEVLTSSGDQTVAEKPDQDEFVLLKALQQGITRRENFRSGQSIAWQQFLLLATRIQHQTSDEKVSNSLARDMLCPLTRQYILPEGDANLWTITDQDASAVAGKALQQAASASQSVAVEFLSSISSSVVEMLQTSLPEQSKGFRESQNKVHNIVDRWARVKLYMLDEAKIESLSEILQRSTYTEVEAAIAVLKSRNGKPFGAVQALRLGLSQLRRSPNQDLQKMIVNFLKTDGSRLIGSPSTEPLLSLFQEADSTDPALKVYDTCLSGLLDQTDSPEKTQALTYFIRLPWPKDTKIADALSHQVENSLHAVKLGDGAREQHIEAALANKSCPSSLTNSILANLTESLSLDEAPAWSLQGLSVAADRNQDAFRDYLKSENSSVLAPRLLLLSQSTSATESKRQLESLSSRVQMLSAEDGDSQGYTNTLVTSINEGLSGNSLDVSILAELAERIKQNSTENTTLLERLVPRQDLWQQSFQPHLSSPPDPSLAIMNVLGNSIELISARDTVPPAAVYDSLGRSLSMRIIEYVTAVFASSPNFVTMPAEEILGPLFSHIAIFNQMASDHLSVHAQSPLWRVEDDHIDSIADAVAKSQNLLRGFVLANKAGREYLRTNLLVKSEGTTNFAYYAARAFSVLAEELAETGVSFESPSADELLALVKLPSVSMREVALFASTSQSPGFSKLVNSLIADLARHDFEGQRERGLRLVILLNRLITSSGFQESTVTQKHRLVLLVKHMISSIGPDAGSFALKAEFLQSLTVLVPLIRDIFDDFWDEMISILLDCFSDKSSTIPVVHSALKLYRELASLSRDNEGTNEDFLESWPGHEKQLHSSLLNLLQNQADFADLNNQPRQIVNQLLARQIASIRDVNIDLEVLFPILSCESPSLQEAAFKYSHTQIPRLQEKVIMDAALVKDYKARIPSELLDLVASTNEEVLDLKGASSVPSSLLQFILSWRLIFDHWVGASYQVQNDYVSSVKDSGHVKLLLDTIFDYLITSRFKPFDASKVPFEKFSLDDGGNIEQQTLTHFCHLYLLSLRHLPGLVRSWYRDECPRSLQRNVAEWSEKYMSPRVVDAELAEVTKWIPKQETDTPLEVKVSTRAREVTAMYPVDEQMAAIRISLPADYPLSTITIEDLNRVGADERKWKSWLVNAQGIMNFAPSSGGIGAVTDGLVAWRRNVTGTLKGQSECAICYSIVNADRQLPTKKCGTCKNAFHGTCLYRWFKSSGGSSCPLCRNAFNYG